MSKLLSVSIDVTKIDKSRLYKGKKGTYLSADIWINDDADEYGNHGSISLQQSKEERDAKAKKVYIGSAKKVYGWDGQASSAPKQQAAAAGEDDDDIPF